MAVSDFDLVFVFLISDFMLRILGPGFRASDFDATLLAFRSADRLLDRCPHDFLGRVYAGE